MKVLIIAEPSQAERIAVTVSSLCRAAGMDLLEICRAVNGTEITEPDFTVVDCESLKTLRTEDAQRLCEQERPFLVHLKGVVFDPLDAEWVSAFMRRLEQQRAWETLRTVNDCMIRIQYLFRRVIVKTYPNYMQLELTDYCNSECIMCSHLYQKNNDASHLDKKTFRAVSKLLPYVRVAILHGNGEALLHPQIDEILEEYCKYGIQVSVTTNLSVFTEKLAGYVNRCFSDIRVSCDACTEHVYEQIRRNLSFARLKENLHKLQTLCPDVRKIMAVVVMQQNIHQLPELVRFAAEYGFSEIIFSNMMPSKALDNEKDSPLRYRASAKRQLRLAQQEADRLGLVMRYPDIYDLQEEEADGDLPPVFPTEQQISDRIAFLRRRYQTTTAPVELLADCDWQQDGVFCEGICDWCMEKTYIDLNGNVFVCCINSKYSLGNLLEQPFSEIWNGDQMQQIRRSFYRGRLPDFCESCHFIMNQSLEHILYVEKNDLFAGKRCVSRLYADSVQQEA